MTAQEPDDAELLTLLADEMDENGDFPDDLSGARRRRIAFAIRRGAEALRVPSPAPAPDADTRPAVVRAADRLAHEVCKLTDDGTLGTRTPVADALLDYGTARHGRDPIASIRATLPLPPEPTR